MNLDWTLPYPVRRGPTLAANVVSTSQPLAAQAGLRMLLAGGNAVDAAIAAAIALTVVEPTSNGIGSDAFAIVWDGRALAGLDASGRSPSAWTPAYFEHLGGIPLRGWNSVTVPGAVSAWVALSERYGKLPFPDLFVPALRYAREGYLVSPTVARLWANQVPALKDEPGFAAAFMPEGRAPRAGERFALPDAADTLEAIADTRGRAFYGGGLAERMEAHAAACGAAMTRADLAAHRPDWVAPLASRYRDLELAELPPAGQGIVALAALGILARFDVRSLPVDGPDSVHLQIEAVKLALADAARFVADRDHMELAASDLLDPAYLAGRAQAIDLRRAQDFGHGAPPRSGTVYLTAADAGGTMVSLIQSNYMGFGSGVVVPGTGVSLQNRGAGFVTKAGHPNRVAPRKRPFHTIIPGFVMRDGAPLAALGLMGGTMQAQGHVQLMVRMADYGQNPQAAIDAPRFRVAQGLDVAVETHFPTATLEELARRGHRLLPVAEGYAEMGCSQIAMRLPGGYFAASDARRDSLAVGF
ncbi:MAG: gamma-glutamyltransferase family protein [Burkholderiales bacterium]|nr:gamma-glutamyltransferase family protein [Burkholderiales bacterium]